MDAQYRILYSGKLLPGQDVDEAASRLAKRFRMQEETAREFLLKGAGRVLKQNLNAAAAEKYRLALTGAGMVITIEPQDAASSAAEVESLLRPYSMASAAAPAQPDPGKPASRKGQAGDGWTACPKCGEMQVSDVTGVCQACGVVAERYLANRGLHTDERATANPYAPPRADLTPPPIDIYDDSLQPPRSTPAGRGWGWILESWDLFRDHPGAWIGAVLLFYLIMIAVNLVPGVGGLASTLLGPMLSAGLMMGAHLQSKGEGFSVTQLFAGASEKPGQLALVGVAYLLFALAIVLVIGGVIALMAGGDSAAILSAAATGPNGIPDPQALMGLFALPVLVAMLLGIPLGMASFFAPALVALDDVPVLRAFKLSFLACLKNILPFLVFSLVALVMLVLGMLPFMLGLILVMPILTIAVYVAYRDIFYY